MSESSHTGSKLDARLKVRLARLRWEERERDFQLRRELESRNVRSQARKALFFCHNPGHLIADCPAWKRKQAATMADEGGIVLSHSGVLAQSNSPHRVCFRKARNRRATHAHSVSPPGPKTKRVSFVLTLVI
ncbi:hypothetical protein F7725_012033 [Dissostichus mawsoni]|uniref:CCHC-type domain-containing protein n=1 Tax=Dissostichus mawsoni TaxID=36200 RepID=A0A7J5ZAJ0_DISMA|nr:hypothetical protein F7725_012033 [Dissostichus mawsoni]